MTDLAAGSEYLAASDTGGHHLVLLHGWGCTPAIWRPILPSLRPWFKITLIDLASCFDGISAGEAYLPTLLSTIMKRTPQHATYVGWSLGGSIATALAAEFPERVGALLTVCSNPKFIAEAGWPGMSRAAFSAFSEEVTLDPGPALCRFDTLQSLGAADHRSLQRQLASLRRESALDTSKLLLQLKLLAELDHRTLLSQLKQPQLHLFAESDELVPFAVCEQLDAALSHTLNAKCDFIADASHAVPLAASQKLADQIIEFATQQGLMEAPAALPGKRQIARSFSSAAPRYDSVAGLQRDVGDSLLNGIRFGRSLPTRVLDLGCGTGYFYSRLAELAPDAQYLGLDLAAGMVEFAKHRFPGEGHWLVGDAEHLPLADNSVDLVFSSLAIQWCGSPQRVFAELARVLRPEGQCVFTSLGPKTLRELRAAWASVDDYQHVNNFVPAATLQHAAAQVPTVVMTLREELFFVQYDRVGELLRELKVLGAHNMNRGRAEGLTTKGSLQSMYQAYELWRSHGTLPATYDVQFGHIEKRG